MPTATYIALANTTLTGSVSGVTFSSIPATYRDLVLVINGTSNSDNRAFYIRFNGTSPDVDTAMVYTSNNTSATDAGLYFVTDTTQFNAIINVMDYSATDKHKTVLFRTNRNAATVMMSAGRWASTNAVTSMTIDRSGFTLQSGTTLALYGIIS